MVYIELDKILKEKGISKYRLASMTGIKPQTISKIAKNNTASINFTTIDKLCKALNCTPGDIIKYK